MRVLALALSAACLGLAPGTTGIPSFAGANAWLNGPPLDARALAGKVVLVDFWEYTCINCLRTLPYLREWYRRYRDDGFTIVGVHTPEFAFSAEPANVERATERLGIGWPVASDANYAIWKRFGTDAWPTEYLFDQQGRLVESFSGEGNYQETEAKIQELLRARDPGLRLPPVMALLPQDDYTKPGAVCYVHTPEELVAHAGIADAPSPDARGREALYEDPGAAAHRDGSIYLQGAWRVAGGGALAVRPPASVSIRYHAIQVVGTLALPDGKPVRVAVTEDGAPVPRADAGADLRYDPDGTSYLTVDASRAYDIVMNAKMARHDLELAVDAPGVAVYGFAFESCEVPKSS